MKISGEGRVRMAAGAVLLVVFAGGLTVGFALDRGVGQVSPERQPTEARLRPPPPPPPPSDWIIDRLELSAAQEAAVDSVVRHWGRHMSELQKEYRPRFQRVVDSTNIALRQLLSEEQRTQYDSLEAELQRRRRNGRR